ncbi:MAG: TetR family transcriptional regulator [Frankiales bacterium]|nr:TetR family transcriptional regulator [Frankiales bacterium]
MARRQTTTTAGAGGRERSSRQQELVSVAARLFSERGFHAVAINDISGQLGLSGPAFYRHFPSKEALLVAVLDECITTHLEDVRDIVTSVSDPADTLLAIVANHIDFVFDQTGNIVTWRTDFSSLPEADRSRLRYLQRLYTEEWVRTLRRLRPDLDDDTARAMCHAAIALLQSPTEFTSGLPREAHAALLSRMARGALVTPPVPRVRDTDAPSPRPHEDRLPV